MTSLFLYESIHAIPSYCILFILDSLHPGYDPVKSFHFSKIHHIFLVFWHYSATSLGLLSKQKSLDLLHEYCYFIFLVCNQEPLKNFITQFLEINLKSLICLNFILEFSFSDEANWAEWDFFFMAFCDLYEPEKYV